MRFPKLAIFDMDGLLINSEEVFMEQKGPVMARYGFSQTREEYIRTLGTSGENLNRILLELYGPDYPADAITKETRANVNAFYDSCGVPVKKGIPELLSYLTGHGVHCCVATSTAHMHAASYLENGSILQYFDFIIGGDEISRSKPDPEIFLKALEKSGTASEDALIFEDSENGIFASQRAGIPVICIPDMKYPCKEAADIAVTILADAGAAIPLLEAARLNR